jgi:hypothetical protein
MVGTQIFLYTKRFGTFETKASVKLDDVNDLNTVNKSSKLVSS